MTISAANHISPDYAVFSEWVRDVLSRLYDSSYLETHPLTVWLVDADIRYTSRSQLLREQVISAIREMRPARTVPAHSPDWRAYRILELRYLDGMTPVEIMEEVALGRSRYFEEQNRVLRSLTRRLWERRRESTSDLSTLSAQMETPGRESAVTRDELVHTETARLKAQPSWEMLDLAEVLNDLQPMVETLVQLEHCTLEILLAPGCLIRGDRILLRQMLLNVMSHAATILPAGTHFEVSLFQDDARAGLEIEADCRVAGKGAPDAFANVSEEASGEPSVELTIGRQLMDAMNGTLEVTTEAQNWRAAVLWPRPETHILLVVDDNEDFLELFRRYLVDQGWYVVGARCGSDARQLLLELRPTVITLDVMMPKEDGWEFLRALQAGQDTCDIPVIVCSVLSEPRLALALGAVDFLAKPVTQAALRQALARWHGKAANPASRR